MTAWLANFLTWDKAFCWHEALKYCRTLDNFSALMNRKDYTYIGNSDSGWPFFFDNVQITKSLIQPKVVVVWRDYREVLESLKQAFPDASENILAMAHIRLKELTDSVDCLQVDFSSLLTEDGVRTIWDYIFEGELKFPDERYFLLSPLNIEVIPEAEIKMGKVASELLQSQIKQITAFN